MPTTYHLTAFEITIYFNKEGDHDHNGLMFALSANVPVLKYLEARAKDKAPANLEDLFKEAEARAGELKISLPLPATTEPEQQQAIWAARVHPLMRPMVLRGNVHDMVHVHLKNEIKHRWIGLHLVGDGYDVNKYDGSNVGGNKHSLVAPGGTEDYIWNCKYEGVFPFHDGGNYSGGEDGTNVHGLFGALIVEPPDAIWRDPVTNRTSKDGELDGLYLDIIPNSPATAAGEQEAGSATVGDDDHWKFPPPQPYFKFEKAAHREFVIFFHDEPEFLPPHKEPPPNPCGHETNHGNGGHGSGHGELLPIMPVSYRAEPMVNREHILWDLINRGHRLERPVLNEEQHHSSWMFGDPATPILKAYIGDPVRIRFVHAGVKETHVFHLHLYEWHAVPQDLKSPRIDAISVSPQTGHTIEPVWGAGNRHQVAGDIIWHCHLYPHFHEGMWGMFRTFETLQIGEEGEELSEGGVYEGRRIGLYPDGTLIEKLLPLPGRKLPPKPTPTHPGYPLYIPGKMKQKSPIPPWPGDNPMPHDFNYRPKPTVLEKNAFNKQPVPGELFTRNPFQVAQKDQWDGKPYDPSDPRTARDFSANEGKKEVPHDIVVAMRPFEYNGHGWHDPYGHLFYLENEQHPYPTELPARREPLFFRALHGQILNLTLRNDLPREIEETEFDHEFPPCPRLNWEGECATHVHMVKFDPICADGASVGWNYMSGPVFGKKMVYRWWLDQDFGTIFFHDHLFANYRQKHGLFGALIVEPIGAKFYDPFTNKPIISGLQAKIKLPQSIRQYVAQDSGQPDTTWFREFCIGIGDFIPMWDRHGNPLNPPDHPGGHGDQGVMALNYRNEPIRERLRDPHDHRKVYDPADWFTSKSPYHRDPYTTIFKTYENDPVWFRLVQGSHEEQHSFQVHGMRWLRFREQVDSFVRNQQTFGIAEAFTFINHEKYKPGDYLYKLSGADDLWLGCWGIIRAFASSLKLEDADYLQPLEAETPVEDTPVPKEYMGSDDSSPYETQIPAGKKYRHFKIRAVQKRLIYRQPDLVDPFGLVYLVDSIEDHTGKTYEPAPGSHEEPLIIRCREDEWVKISLYNDLPKHKDFTLKPEPFAPEVPVETVNPFSHRPERPVSTQVSLHADLVKYDVYRYDGANVGRNRRQTARPGDTVIYEWNPCRPTQQEIDESLGPVLLQDMADFRNHRHHGLVGALIIEKAGATPYVVAPGSPTANEDETKEAWNGSRATIRFAEKDSAEQSYEEAVLLLQDGLRFFLHGHTHSPIADEPPGIGEDDVDHEDQGQKGFNYRSEPVGALIDPQLDTLTKPPEDWLSNDNPATPIFYVPQGKKVRLHLVGACDKPRNHSFTIHGVSWPEWRFREPGKGPMVSSESAITCGTVRTFEFTPEYGGDHAYRSGVLKWAVPQGLWGILCVI